jgi:serine/threonine protein kinase
MLDKYKIYILYIYMRKCIKSLCNVNPRNIVQSIEAVQPQVRLLHLKLIEKLGEGGTSIVYKALNIENKKFYICKILSTEQKLKAYREVEVLKKLTGNYFPNFNGLFCTENKMHIVTDYVKGEDLFEYISIVFEKEGEIKFDAIGQYTLKIATIINDLHSQGFVHLDIKLENFILLKDDPITLQLIDFGTAHPMVEKRGKITTSAGTLGYSPIEIYDRHYHRNSDVWSLGIIIWILITGEAPFDHSILEKRDESEIFPVESFIFPVKKHLDHKYLMPDETFELFIKIFDLEPEKRANIDEILNHKPFSG